MTSPSPWKPAQYERFKDERSQPFHDLLALVRPISGGRAVDLGCGTGELTRLMHERTGVAQTLGLDSSETMLERSRAFAGQDLSFAQGDISAFEDGAGFDLVFSNAALQWVDDHETLFPRLARLLRPGGQLAVQMPANHDHPSHLVAHEVAAQEPFASALGGYVRNVPVQEPEWYARLLFSLGFAEQSVGMHVYPHVLSEPSEVIEWVKGTLLTDYEKRLPPELFAEYMSQYRRKLLPVLGDERPYFYAFKRILIWARL